MIFHQIFVFFLSSSLFLSNVMPIFSLFLCLCSSESLFLSFLFSDSLSFLSLLQISFPFFDLSFPPSSFLSISLAFCLYSSPSFRSIFSFLFSSLFLLSTFFFLSFLPSVAIYLALFHYTVLHYGFPLWFVL